MKQMIKARALVLSAVSTALVGIGMNAFAHTRLDIPTMVEGTRTINHVVITHSCGDTKRTIGTSVVFPDGVDSTILVGGQPHTGSLTDFVENWGNTNQMIMNKAVFTVGDEKIQNGNVVGFWAGGGEGMPNHLYSTLPFRASAVNIAAASCAKSVKFYVSIVDICEITGVDALRTGTGEAGGVANLWTHNNLGTPYDRVSATDDGPASLTITRDLTKKPLPESCGAGVDVEVKPSAAQINRDMPIIYNGQQVWPK